MKDLSNGNVIHVKKDGLEYLQFRKLLEFSDTINHAYSLGLNMNFNTGDRVLGKLPQNRLKIAMDSYKSLCNAIDSDFSHVVKPRQKHTKEVKCVTEQQVLEVPNIYSEKYKNTDGLITNIPEVMLATTNADCILLLFFDPVKKVIANIHSGWRGTLQRISVNAVKKMKEEYGCNMQDIICCICPSIRKCHFEVEKEVKDLFEQEFDNPKEFIEETVKEKKWNIDTVAINKSILEQEGLLPENIIDSGICSVCNKEQIHSFRAEGKGYGLSTALIEIKP